MPSFRPSWLSRMLSVLLSLTLLLTLSGCAPSQEFGLQNRPPVDPATYFGRDYEDQAAIMTELKEKTSPIFENSDVDIITTGEIEIVDSLPEDESSESSHTEESSENSESSENHESSENSENSESSENHESSESSESSEASSSESSESSSESSENSENSTTGGTFLAHDHTPFFTWGRDQLTPAEQEGYDIICDYIANYRTDTITLPLTYDEVYRIADAIDMDRPDFYWYFYDLRMLNNGDGTLSLWAYSMDNNATGYSMSKETALELEDWIDQEVELILSDVDSSWSDYEKALYVYNYLTRNVVYDIDTLNDQSPVAALVYHRAVCASYAEAFQYLMLELGIPSTKAVGYATGFPAVRKRGHVIDIAPAAAGCEHSAAFGAGEGANLAVGIFRCGNQEGSVCLFGILRPGAGNVALAGLQIYGKFVAPVRRILAGRGCAHLELVVNSLGNGRHGGVPAVDVAAECQAAVGCKEQLPIVSFRLGNSVPLECE